MRRRREKKSYGLVVEFFLFRPSRSFFPSPNRLPPPLPRAPFSLACEFITPSPSSSSKEFANFNFDLACSEHGRTAKKQSWVKFHTWLAKKEHYPLSSVSIPPPPAPRVSSFSRQSCRQLENRPTSFLPPFLLSPRFTSSSPPTVVPSKPQAPARGGGGGGVNASSSSPPPPLFRAHETKRKWEQRNEKGVEKVSHGRKTAAPTPSIKARGHRN